MSFNYYLVLRAFLSVSNLTLASVASKLVVTDFFIVGITYRRILI